MVISVGYKVNSERAIRFRRWVTYILKNAGKILYEIAVDKVLTEFEKYRIIQDQIYPSDFDKYINELEKLDVSDKCE